MPVVLRSLDLPGKIHDDEHDQIVLELLPWFFERDARQQSTGVKRHKNFSWRRKSSMNEFRSKICTCIEPLPKAKQFRKWSTSSRVDCNGINVWKRDVDVAVAFEDLMTRVKKKISVQFTLVIVLPLICCCSSERPICSSSEKWINSEKKKKGKWNFSERSVRF